MSHFFIHRPIFATVISIVIVVAGIVSFGSLPVAKFPEIAPPTVDVSAVYPGADAKTVAETVATPIEQQVNGVEGMLYMSSTSANDGSYTLTVTFEVGTDMDMAAVLVQNRVAVAEPTLPPEVKQQGITTKKKSTQILQFIALTSPDQRYDALFLSNYSLDVRDELSRVPGVGEAKVFGVGDYSMRIWLDADKLEQRGLTTQDIVKVIQEQNAQVAAGKIGAAPAPAGTAFELSVNTKGRLVDKEEFEEIVVATGENGRVLQLKDVARVELGGKTYNIDSSFRGRPAALLAIYQLPGANALETAAAVRARMQALRAASGWPTGVDYSIAFDSTRFVEASVREVYSTLLIAVLLVVLVIFVFLQDWRATIIPVAAIPVSLIGTFAVMSGLGFSINMLSLFGVVLAIGIVVDDAIVVVENASRHLEAGLQPKEAASKAMSEITGPVIATSLVLLAVFVPTAFMAGITGELFRQFALTISSAVVISTINALTLSPALCGLVLRKPRESRFIAFRLFNRFFERCSSVYGATVQRLVRVIAVVAVAYVALVAVTGYGFAALPTGFVPSEDQGYLFVDVQLPDAAAKERTDAVMRQLEELYPEIPGVESWVSVSGYSLLAGTANSSVGFSVVVLDPWEQRSPPTSDISGVLKNLRQAFQQIPSAVIFPFEPPPIDGLGTAGGFQMELLDQSGAGYTELQLAAQSLVEAGRSQAGLAALNSTFRASVPQLFADIDRRKAKSMDVPLDSVFGTMQAYLGSAYVNDFTLNNRSYQVRVQAEPAFRSSADDILALDVRDSNGEMVPMASLINVEESFGPAVVRRFNQYPSAAINGSAAPGVSSGQAMAVMEQMAEAQLPPGFGYAWTGMSYQEKVAAGGQGAIFALAVLFVFLVLAAQYESWTSPAAVIAVVPLAALGVVLALAMRGAENNTYTQIGVVLLVALASKNAILIVEFAMDQRRLGKSVRESAAGAAELRFRAILMTAFSSILGFLPLLIASGAGAASRQAVGNAVVGGMIAATLFSLLFVPVFFVIFQSLGELVGRKNAG